MGRKVSFVAALWWLLIGLLLGVLLLCFAERGEKESDAENRVLQDFPELSADTVASGRFMSEFEAFLSDRFFARDAVVEAAERVEGVFSRQTQEDRFALDTAEQAVTAIGAASAPASTEPEEEAVEEEPSAPVDPNAQYSFWLDDVGGGRTRVYSFPMQNVETFAETLNLYRAALPEDGLVHFAQIPFAATANRWTLQPERYCGWGSDVEDGLAARVGQGVYVYNTTALLKEHMAAGETLYYRTDHHWAPRGAYYVFAAMMARQNLPVTLYDEYAYKRASTSKQVDGVRDELEVLYPLAPARSLVVKERTREMELDLMNYGVSSYRAYMNNTRTPWRRIVTGFTTGRKALLICDSFGNAFAPFLLPYYDELHMTDTRVNYYDKAEAGGSVKELIEYYGIDDVYILLSTANGMNSENGLRYLRKYFLE